MSIAPNELDRVIEVRQATKRFGPTLAVDRLDLIVRRGTVFGLLGPNGAGKSTLIRMLMGLVEIDEGSAHLLGHDVRARSPALRQQIGYVPELHFIYRWMTVDQVLDFVGQLYVRWDRSVAEQYLSKFELSPRKKVSSLSKGMVAKLGLLIALSHSPELLILDEPTSGLDPIIREDFLESVLQSHAGNGKSVLFSSHHVDDVERVADEVGIMVDGRIVLTGAVDELRDRVKRVRLVLPDGMLPKAIPSEVIHQRLNRREWTVTLDPFSIELLHRLQAGNQALQADVFDLCLEDIFKDVVRGRKSAVEVEAECLAR